MNPSLPGNDPLSPTLRALALGVLLETVVPLPEQCRQGSSVPSGELWQALRCMCAELSALVVRADDPEEAAAYVLDYLPLHLEAVLGTVQCRACVPVTLAPCYRPKGVPSQSLIVPSSPALASR
jgi:hypothetical protein